ncbi:MAG TPA: hypothetical protein PLX66_00185 [Bacilli bacterium]|nr:hypothetical protein [Bacilli bacterium]
MTIGIDIDDTMTCSSEAMLEYAKKYFKINDDNIVREILNGEIKGELFKFYNIHLGKILTNCLLKKDVKKVIDKLRKTGNKVIIITARGYTKFKDDIPKITKEYLKKHNIEVDKIVFNKLDKVKACLDNNIDIMIDDSINVLDKVKENNIKVLLFTSISNENKNTDIDRVDNWLELEKYIFAKNT